jgi:hypothetical protein
MNRSIGFTGSVSTRYPGPWSAREFCASGADADGNALHSTASARYVITESGATPSTTPTRWVRVPVRGVRLSSNAQQMIGDAC